MVEAYPRNRKACKRCGTVFRLKPSHYDKKTYCSRDCMAADYRERLRGEANPRFSAASQRVCVECGALFHNYSKTAKFCSLACRSKNPGVRQALADQVRARWVRAPWTPPTPKPKPPKPPRVRHCRTCRAALPHGWEGRCCAGCGQQPTPCVVCGASFPKYAGQNKRTCSPGCARAYRSIRQKGARSHRWQGGKTSEAILVRTSADYGDWRSAVFKRDGFTCQLCHERGGKLAAHHIKRFALHRELAMDVRNGVTLCWPCHQGIKGKEAEYEARFASYTGLVLRGEV